MDATLLPAGIMTLIKSATAEAVLAAAAPGKTGPQRVAEMTGYSAGQISRLLKEGYPDTIHLAMAMHIEFATQVPVFARAFASLTGHRLVPMEDGAGGDDFLHDLLALSRSAADLQATYGDVLEDGQVTPSERARLRQAHARHQAVAMRAERRVTPVAEDGADG